MADDIVVRVGAEAGKESGVETAMPAKRLDLNPNNLVHGQSLNHGMGSKSRKSYLMSL